MSKDMNRYMSNDKVLNQFKESVGVDTNTISPALLKTFAENYTRDMLSPTSQSIKVLIEEYNEIINNNSPLLDDDGLSMLESLNDMNDFLYNEKPTNQIDATHNQNLMTDIRETLNKFFKLNPHIK